MHASARSYTTVLCSHLFRTQRVRVLSVLAIKAAGVTARWLLGEAEPELGLHALCVYAPCSEQEPAASSLHLIVRGDGAANIIWAVNSSEQGQLLLRR